MTDYESPFAYHRMALLRSTIPVGRGLAVDIGCNDGTFTTLLVEKGYNAVGVDLDAEAVARGHILFPALDLRTGSEGSAAALAPRPMTLCLELIEHLLPDAQVELLQTIAAATSPGGKLILSTPGRYSAYSVYERVRRPNRGYNWWDPTHVAVLSWRRLRRMLTNAGFVIERLTGYYYLPERIVTPFGSDLRPLARLGFVLVVTAVHP